MTFYSRLGWGANINTGLGSNSLILSFFSCALRAPHPWPPPTTSHIPTPHPPALNPPKGLPRAWQAPWVRSSPTLPKSTVARELREGKACPPHPHGSLNGSMPPYRGRVQPSSQAGPKMLVHTATRFKDHPYRLQSFWAHPYKVKVSPFNLYNSHLPNVHYNLYHYTLSHHYKSRYHPITCILYISHFQYNQVKVSPNNLCYIFPTLNIIKSRYHPITCIIYFAFCLFIIPQ